MVELCFCLVPCSQLTSVQLGRWNRGSSEPWCQESSSSWWCWPPPSGTSHTAHWCIWRWAPSWRKQETKTNHCKYSAGFLHYVHKCLNLLPLWEKKPHTVSISSSFENPPIFVIDLVSKTWSVNNCELHLHSSLFKHCKERYNQSKSLSLRSKDIKWKKKQNNSTKKLFKNATRYHHTSLLSQECHNVVSPSTAANVCTILRINIYSLCRVWHVTAASSWHLNQQSPRVGPLQPS